jgi:hypothetical protein
MCRLGLEDQKPLTLALSQRERGRMGDIHEMHRLERILLNP